MVARIGDDDFGRMALKLWADEGIATQHVEVARNESSGVAQILVFDDGDNSIAVAVGAGAGLGEESIHQAREAISAAKVVMSSNEVPLAATLAAFKIARAAGVTTILNPAPAADVPDELLALCDVLTPNEAEAQSLLGRAAGAMVVTLGAAGCAIYQPVHQPVHQPVQSSQPAQKPVQQLAGFAMPVVDTIGAGDTFTGALAAALARGELLAQAARVANAAAALSVTGKDAIGAMPTLAQSHFLLETT